MSVYRWMARPICFRLFVHVIRFAASRTFCTAGSRRAMSTPMIAITTSNSISVNPLDGLRLFVDAMTKPPPARPCGAGWAADEEEHQPLEKHTRCRRIPRACGLLRVIGGGFKGELWQL